MLTAKNYSENLLQENDSFLRMAEYEDCQQYSWCLKEISQVSER